MSQDNDIIIIDETLDKSLAIIKEIDILMESEKDKDCLNDMLLLREQLQSLEKITGSYFHIKE
jgi:hypothetical protein